MRQRFWKWLRSYADRHVEDSWRLWYEDGSLRATSPGSGTVTITGTLTGLGPFTKT